MDPVPELDQDGWYECAVCGRRRHESDRCGCAADGGGEAPTVPAGWDPRLTTGGGARLPLMGRPAPERREPAAGAGPEPDATPEG